MPITWPATLPQRPLAEGYQETEPDVLLRSPMDAGPPKVRLRFTAGVQPVMTTWEMTGAEVETFRTFYRTTIKYGAIQFEHINFRTGATVTYAIPAPPVERNVGGDVWQVQIPLEIWP